MSRTSLRAGRSARWWGAVGVAVVFIASACGEDSETKSSSTTSPAVTSTSSTTTTVAMRTVALREATSMKVGESVAIRDQGMTLTYKSVVSDSRCRPGWQCIQAGEASIAVTAAKDGLAPADLTIGAPGFARYGKYTIEVLSLSYDQSDIARLKVS